MLYYQVRSYLAERHRNEGTYGIFSILGRLFRQQNHESVVCAIILFIFVKGLIKCVGRMHNRSLLRRATKDICAGEDAK